MKRFLHPVWFAVCTVPLLCLITAITHPTQTDVISSGTTIVIVLTKDGFVVGSDHTREEISKADPSSKRLKVEHRPKFVWCGTEIICASVGLGASIFDCSMESASGVVESGRLEYRLDVWVHNIKDHSGGTESPSPRTVARAISNKAQATFKPIECELKTSPYPFGTSDQLIAFWVVGYSQTETTPEIYEVRIRIDRNSMELIYEPPKRVYPSQKKGKVPYVWFAGEREHILAINQNREPEASRFRFYYVKRLERAQLLLKDAPLNIQRAVALATSYIDVESEFNNKVGGGASIGIVRRGNSHQTTVYMPEWKSNQ